MFYQILKVMIVVILIKIEIERNMTQIDKRI